MDRPFLHVCHSLFLPLTWMYQRAYECCSMPHLATEFFIRFLPFWLLENLDVQRVQASVGFTDFIILFFLIWSPLKLVSYSVLESIQCLQSRSLSLYPPPFSLFASVSLLGCVMLGSGIDCSHLSALTPSASLPPPSRLGFKAKLTYCVIHQTSAPLSPLSLTDRSLPRQTHTGPTQACSAAHSWCFAAYEGVNVVNSVWGTESCDIISFSSLFLFYI